jgi:hypothetical protein
MRGRKREATSVFDPHWIRIQSGQQQNQHNEIQSTSKKLKDEKWRWIYEMEIRYFHKYKQVTMAGH